jgi:hypothetical protein
MRIHRLFFLFCVSVMVTGQSVTGQGLSPFPPMSDIMPQRQELSRMNAEERVSLIKANLALTPSQTKYWADIEVALVELLELRDIQRKETTDELVKRREANLAPDPVRRLQLNSKHLRENADKTENLSRKLSYLYPLLDAGQKRRLTALLPRQGEPRTRANLPLAE